MGKLEAIQYVQIKEETMAQKNRRAYVIEDCFSIIEDALRKRSESVQAYANQCDPLPYPISLYDDISAHDTRHGMIIESALIFTNENMPTIDELRDYAERYEAMPKESPNSQKNTDGVTHIQVDEKMDQIVEKIISYIEDSGERMNYIRRSNIPSFKVASAISVMHLAKHLE